MSSDRIRKYYWERALERLYPVDFFTTFFLFLFLFLFLLSDWRGCADCRQLQMFVCVAKQELELRRAEQCRAVHASRELKHKKKTKTNTLTMRKRMGHNNNNYRPVRLARGRLSSKHASSPTTCPVCARHSSSCLGFHMKFVGPHFFQPIISSLLRTTIHHVRILIGNMYTCSGI